MPEISSAFARTSHRLCGKPTSQPSFPGDRHEKFQDQALNSSRAGLAAAVDLMTATAEGAERLCTHQLATISQALAENSGPTVRINEAENLNDLMAVYSTLAGIQLKYISVYGSGIHRMVSENQAAFHKLVQTQSVELQRQLSASLEAAVNGGPEPVVEVVKATVTAISAGLSTLARATAESVRLAAAQVANADTATQPIGTMTKHARR